MLGLPFNRTRQHGSFDLTATLNHLVSCCRMAYSPDILFDDWSLIEISGDKMRSRTDQLDPTIMCLVIGLRTLEAGQEGMMDVDAPS